MASYRVLSCKRSTVKVNMMVKPMSIYCVRSDEAFKALTFAMYLNLHHYYNQGPNYGGYI